MAPPAVCLADGDRGICPWLKSARAQDGLDHRLACRDLSPTGPAAAASRRATVRGERGNALAVGPAALMTILTIRWDEPLRRSGAVMVQPLEEIVHRAQREGLSVLLVDSTSQCVAVRPSGSNILETGQIVHQGDAKALASAYRCPGRGGSACSRAAKSACYRAMATLEDNMSSTLDQRCVTCHTSLAFSAYIK